MDQDAKHIAKLNLASDAMFNLFNLIDTLLILDNMVLHC